MRGLSQILLRHAVFALAVLALLSVPFAHRAGAAPVTPEMRQFIAMGGSLSDICGDSVGHIAGGCESCANMAAPVLCAPVVLPYHPVTFCGVKANLNRTAFACSAMPHSTPPVRAPPQL